MLYLSLTLIFLGIVIFLFSILLDAKRRHEGQRYPAAHGASSPGESGAAPSPAKEATPAASIADLDRGKRIQRGGAAQGRGPSAEKAPASDRKQAAVLFEDKSSVIDYSSESGSIDPSLEKYRNIKRIGSGTISVEAGGITFYMGKKLYRYDFHRVRDIKVGKNHLALFLMGSGSVKLFIIEPGSGVTAAANDAFREYVRSSA